RGDGVGRFLGTAAGSPARGGGSGGSPGRGRRVQPRGGPAVARGQAGGSRPGRARRRVGDRPGDWPPPGCGGGYSGQGGSAAGSGGGRSGEALRPTDRGRGGGPEAGEGPGVHRGPGEVVRPAARAARGTR